MAHQLNYCLHKIPSEDIFAVYNADSRPEPETFAWVLSNTRSNKQQAFQQYGVYTSNTDYLKSQRWSNILLSNAAWQCRWSLGFEFYRAQSGIDRGKLPKLFKPFNYCIGHGLLVTAKFAKDIRFSENTTNEDAMFGVELSSSNIEIEPIPYFDLSESPDNIPSIYSQKSVWFQGPFQALAYAHILHKEGRMCAASMIDCMKLFSHAVYWVVGPVSAIYVIAYGIISLPFNTYGLVVAVTPIVFLVIPNILSSLLLSGITKWPSVPLLKISTGSVFAYIVHGASGVRGILLSNKYLNQGTKRKTKMSQYGEY